MGSKKIGGSQIGKSEHKGSGGGSKQIYQSTLIEKEKKQLEKMKIKQVITSYLLNELMGIAWNIIFNISLNNL